MFAHPFWGCGRFWALLACSHYIIHSIEGVRAHLAPFPLSKISPADWDATHDTINSLGPGHYWIVRTQHPGYIPVPNPAAGPNDDQFVKYPAALVATHLVPSCYRPTADSDKWWYVYHPKTLISTKVFLVDPLPASNSHVAPNSDPPLKSHLPLSSSQRLPPKAAAISKLRADAPPFIPSVRKTRELRGKEACEEIALTKNGNEHSEQTVPPIATELPNFPPSSGVTGAMLSQPHTPASLAPLLSRTGSAAGPSRVNTNAEALISSALGTSGESSRNGHHPKSVHPQNISTPEVDNKPPLDQILTKTGNPHGASQNEGIPDSVSGEEVYSVTEKLKQDEAFNQAPRYDSPSAITPNEEKSVNVGTVSGAQESTHTSTLNAPESMERIHMEAETVGCLYPVQPEDSKRTRQKGKSRYHKQPTRSEAKQISNPERNQDRLMPSADVAGKNNIVKIPPASLTKGDRKQGLIEEKIQEAFPVDHDESSSDRKLRLLNDKPESLTAIKADDIVDAITKNHISLPLKTLPDSKLINKPDGSGADLEPSEAMSKAHNLESKNKKSWAKDRSATFDLKPPTQAGYLSTLRSHHNSQLVAAESSHSTQPLDAEDLYSKSVILELDRGTKDGFKSEISNSAAVQAGQSSEKATAINKHGTSKQVMNMTEGKKNGKTKIEEDGLQLTLKGKSSIISNLEKEQSKKSRRKNPKIPDSYPQEGIEGTREQKNRNKLILSKEEYVIPLPPEEKLPHIDEEIYGQIPMPRSDLKEDEIYPGIKSGEEIQSDVKSISNQRNKDRNSKPVQKKGINWDVVLNDFLETNKHVFTNKMKEKNIDWNYIELLSIHLKLDNPSPHLPLSDMDLETYMQLRYMWKRDKEQCIAAIISLIAITEKFEGVRRIKTMLKQAYEHTIVQNWKTIKEVLIKQGDLTNQEAKDIEAFYKLSERFPKRTYTQKTYDLNKPKCGGELLVKILSSLGVFKSKRHETFHIDNFLSHDPPKNSIRHTQDDLESRIVTNGLEPRKLCDRLKHANPGYSVVDLFKIGTDTLNSGGWNELVPWNNSAEFGWILEPLGYSTL
ncbi:hypothetical protein Pst134EB_020113 [Puccinia striiformis f. sp. tritici]|nr:hypothetical protein Pst134EB_020113 [Puccinia striiformis f. sp. tritici]